MWKAEITVLQHGRHPLPDAADAKPTVAIVNGATGKRRTFTAAASDPAAGRYEARVVFPSPGAWSYEVFDGFTSWNGEPAPCAQTHAFAAVQIDGPRSAAGDRSAHTTGGFPVWPLMAGMGGLLAVGAPVYFFRRHRVRAPATA